MHTRRPKRRPRQRESQLLSIFSFPSPLLLLQVFPARAIGNGQHKISARRCYALAFSSGGEELLDQNGGIVRILLRKKVPALHRLSVDARSPLPPNAQGPAIFCVESVQRAALGPKMKHRTADAPGCFLARTIVLDINRGRGTVFLADSMNAAGIAVIRKIR